MFSRKQASRTKSNVSDGGENSDERTLSSADEHREAMHERNASNGPSTKAALEDRVNQLQSKTVSSGLATTASGKAKKGWQRASKKLIAHHRLLTAGRTVSSGKSRASILIQKARKTSSGVMTIVQVAPAAANTPESRLAAYHWGRLKTRVVSAPDDEISRGRVERGKTGWNAVLSPVLGKLRKDHRQVQEEAMRAEQEKAWKHVPQHHQDEYAKLADWVVAVRRESKGGEITTDVDHSHDHELQKDNGFVGASYLATADEKQAAAMTRKKQRRTSIADGLVRKLGASPRSEVGTSDVLGASGTDRLEPHQVPASNLHAFFTATRREDRQHHEQLTQSTGGAIPITAMGRLKMVSAVLGMKHAHDRAAAAVSIDFKITKGDVHALADRRMSTLELAATSAAEVDYDEFPTQLLIETMPKVYAKAREFYRLAPTANTSECSHLLITGEPLLSEMRRLHPVVWRQLVWRHADDHRLRVLMRMLKRRQVLEQLLEEHRKQKELEWQIHEGAIKGEIRERLDQAWASVLTYPARTSQALYRRARYTDIFRVLGRMSVLWGALLFIVFIIVHVIISES